MYGFLLTFLVLDGIFLSVVILLQSGKGGGLAAMGGSPAMTEGILGGRQATTMLTRATWTAGTLFMVLSLVLSIMSSRSRQPDSILRQEFQQQQQGAPAPEPVLPGLQEEPPPAEGGEVPPPGSGGPGAGPDGGR